MENLKCLFTNFPLDIFLFWLIPFLLMAWWLWNKVSRYKAHVIDLQDRINFLEGELDACRKSKINKSAEVNIQESVVETATPKVPVAKIAATKPKPAKKDDLKIVEGIGPKIEELCHTAGIYTFAELADTSVEKLRTILEQAGSRFQMHDPTTWPAQAELARDGKWDELKQWQDELNKGRQ